MVCLFLTFVAAITECNPESPIPVDNAVFLENIWVKCLFIKCFSADHDNCFLISDFVSFKLRFYHLQTILSLYAKLQTL